MGAGKEVLPSLACFMLMVSHAVLPQKISPSAGSQPQPWWRRRRPIAVLSRPWHMRCSIASTLQPCARRHFGWIMYVNNEQLFLTTHLLKPVCVQPLAPPPSLRVSASKGEAKRKRKAMRGGPSLGRHLQVLLPRCHLSFKVVTCYLWTHLEKSN
jgi:hypothetical protein